MQRAISGQRQLSLGAHQRPKGRSQRRGARQTPQETLDRLKAGQRSETSQKEAPGVEQQARQGSAQLSRELEGPELGAVVSGGAEGQELDLEFGLWLWPALGGVSPVAPAGRSSSRPARSRRKRGRRSGGGV